MNTTIIRKAPLVRFAPLMIFGLMHLGCLSLFFIAPQTSWLWLCFALYLVQMFGITAGYHRYFSHRSFKTSRIFQFVLAFLGSLALQKGVLWWAANHRIHHRYSGQKEDIHAPEHRGFWWSHIGWILTDEYDATQWSYIKDLQKYPELVWINKYHYLPAVILSVAIALTLGWEALLWGYLLSNVLSHHATFFINSLCHMFGRRRFTTKDNSKNSLIMALITLGEGWHNNHHHYQHSARQGFFWWEIDISFYVLKFLSFFKIVWEFKTPPATIYKKTKSQSKISPLITHVPASKTS